VTSTHLITLFEPVSATDCNLATHLYSAPGVHTVALTVNGPGGTDTMNRVSLIVVEDYRVYLPVV
jgi:PKD repeat protein